jgi:hypothetical protein
VETLIKNRSNELVTDDTQKPKVQTFQRSATNSIAP